MLLLCIVKGDGDEPVEKKPLIEIDTNQENVPAEHAHA
jgi:hypothetical protein